MVLQDFGTLGYGLQWQKPHRLFFSGPVHSKIKAFHILLDSWTTKRQNFFPFLCSRCYVMWNWTSRGGFSYRQRMREFAGLEKDVVLTGNINRIEIWSKEKWNENSNYDDMDAIAESMEEMGIVI